MNKPFLWFDEDQESWMYDKPLRPTYTPLFKQDEANLAESIRPMVLRFADMVNLNPAWCKDNEPTENILRSCLHKYQAAMHLIKQGVKNLENE